MPLNRFFTYIFFYLQISVPIVHTVVQITASLLTLCENTPKMPKKQLRGLVPTIQPEPDFFQKSGSVTFVPF